MSEKCVLVDLERSVKSGYITYWKPNKMGYTRNINEAGIYDNEQGKKIAAEDFDNRTVVINQSVIDNILI